ncbi:thiamine pyrophosphate-binding protein [Jeotgalibacillus sp. S-D1]|uniref:thiamine pyrophosphate-binding protein n=1 Tax=Jeotgalibacillus sp. S-D1 TaxID=2552189 RepID=UPI00105A64D8|nr:thiamine pyrophosphate-binding protein [Jeotgalibacillus sp. S-D1]TDL34895.1 thiamine pyrophosphate-binding protein [Jeotgalibacillus sp. S-D1]
MKNAAHIVDYLLKGQIDYLFGIPAGSVNAIFDELYDRPSLTPVIAKHEGAAAFMASAYAKYSGKLGVVIGCSGPGAMNLVSGAANASREQIPLLILTGSVPLSTLGWNASQELNATPVFSTVTKYSKTVTHGKDLVSELEKAVNIAFDGVPGPVHLALPIDVQLQPSSPVELPEFPIYSPCIPSKKDVEAAADEIKDKNGVLFIGNGARGAAREAVQLAELLDWPFVTTPQAKGLIPTDHPLHKGIYGFAGHSEAVKLIHEGSHDIILIIGSSLGETATSNYQDQLTAGRKVIQIDRDSTVFTRKYDIHLPVLGDCKLTIAELLLKLPQREDCQKHMITPKLERTCNEPSYDTKTVLPLLQSILPENTKYTADIGEFMSYILHYMEVKQWNTFDINVHYGSMGTGIGSSIGLALAKPEEEVACITGDGCFFMHGMEILTAKEYNLPITFIVINNSRLGMVHHGHALQYKRVHPRFSQSKTSIAALVDSFNIPAVRITSLKDLENEDIEGLLSHKGPRVIEFDLVDNNVPPMGDRVKFLSSFSK